MAAASDASATGVVSEAPVKELSTKANMIWNSVGSMTYLGCQWLVTILVVRLSDGYDAAGLLSLAMAVSGTFGTFANYKMGTYQISDIRHEHTLAEYLGFRCITLAIAFFACMAYAALTCAPNTLVTIALYYLFKAVGLVIDILHGCDQQHRRMDYIGKSFILQGVSTLAAFVAVMGLTNSLDAAIIAMMVAAVAVFAVFDFRKTRQFERICVRIGATKALFFFRTSLPAVLASLAASAIFTIPKQYLSFSDGDAALGIYGSVSAIALIVQMGAQYLYLPLIDVFPRLYFDGDRAGFSRLLARTVVAIVGVAAACIAVLAFLGAPVLAILFGESIAPYTYLLQPVLVSTVLTAFLWFFGDLLIALRDFPSNFIGNIVAFVAVIPLSFVCVDMWGMNGVSFATAGACGVGVAVLAVCLARRLRAIPAPRTCAGANREGDGADVGEGERS